MTQLIPADYGNWLQGLKDQIRTARLKAGLAVNRELIQLYWRIGKEIVHLRAKRSWGSKVLDQLAKDLRAEFPDMRGLSLTNLKYMALFAQAWTEEAIGQQAVDQLPWGQNIAIFTMVSDPVTREWYVRKTTENGWSRAVLEMQIESQAHKRFGSAQNNFDRTLPAPQSDLARDLIKDPHAFDFLGITAAVNERQIEQSLLNHLRDFLIELGVGFAFVGSQYKLDIEGDEFYIDLLFYHLKLHCYVVIELKNTEFKFEYTGQLNGYLAAVDDLVRDAAVDAPTIGLILCKSKKKTMVEYALRGVQTPMGVSTYRTSPELPKELADLLPSIEALTAELDAGADVLTIPD
jgi:predicted nuclease of restriction endonuclease-like (RecB) superfamily